MLLEKYQPSPKDTWTWRQAGLQDIDQMVTMAVNLFQVEIEDVFTPDPDMLAKNIAIAVIKQKFNPIEEQIIVAVEGDRVIAWAWIVRGVYVNYAKEEMADARIAHLDLDMPARKRITLLAQILQQWELWCKICSIPVLSSSTIRSDQGAFLHLHREAGFTVRGSISYKRIDLC
jgi:hypothetical protein